MAFSSRWISAVFIAAWNILSLIAELILYKKVYQLAGETLSKKVVKAKPSESKLMSSGDLLFLSIHVFLGTAKNSGLSK